MHRFFVLSIVSLFPSLLTANTVISAVRTGNLNAVKRAVGAVTDINTTDSLGRSALHHAAIVGNFEIINYLLANDADPKQKDLNNKVPFQLAIEEKMSIEQAKVASVLLHAAKGGVEGRDDKGWNALHWAILAKDRPLIDRWLDEGATLLRNRSGFAIYSQHPIEVAFLTQDAQLIDYLVDRYDEWAGENALQYAANSNLRNLIEALTKVERNLSFDVNARDKNNNIPLHNAIRAAGVVNNSVNRIRVRTFIEHGADVEIRNSDGKTPLMVAAGYGLSEIVQALIEGGADIHATLAGDTKQDARYFAEQALQAKIADAPYKAILVPYKYRRTIELLMR